MNRSKLKANKYFTGMLDDTAICWITRGTVKAVFEMLSHISDYDKRKAQRNIAEECWVKLGWLNIRNTDCEQNVSNVINIVSGNLISRKGREGIKVVMPS